MVPEYEGWRTVPAHLYTRTQLSDLDLPRIPGGPVRAYVTARGAVRRRETFDLYDVRESLPAPASARRLEAGSARRDPDAYRCADCGAHTERPAIHLRESDSEARTVCLACRHIAALRAFQARLADLRADACQRAADWLALDHAAVLHVTALTPPLTGSGRRRPPVAYQIDALTPSGTVLLSLAARLRRSRHPLVPDGALDWPDAITQLRATLHERHLLAWRSGELDPIAPALLAADATAGEVACYQRCRTISYLNHPVAQWRGELDPDTGELRAARHPGRADLLALLIRRMAADHTNGGSQ